MKNHVIQGTVIALAILAAFGAMELIKRQRAKRQAADTRAALQAAAAAANTAATAEADQDIADA